MVLKVIASGTGHTGTASLVQALEQLGFGECFSKSTVAAHCESIETLHTAYNGGKVDWHSFFNERYQCVADFPASWFNEELIQAYPDATVVLTVCDPQEWYGKARDTIREFNPLMKSNLAGFSRLEKLSNKIWDSIFELNLKDGSKAIELYHTHLVTVRNAVSSNKLLVFDV